MFFQSCLKELIKETQAIKACVSLITATLLWFILFVSYCWKRGTFDQLQCFFKTASKSYLKKHEQYKGSHRSKNTGIL